MIFSSPPKATELRKWASARGYHLLPQTGDGFVSPETWIDANGRWRLKIKRPATRAGLQFGSYQERFSCRELNPITNEMEYFDSALESFGTRGTNGHLALEIDEPTPSLQEFQP